MVDKAAVITADNIRINNLLPGFVDSNPRRASSGRAYRWDATAGCRMIPDTIAFLASDGAGYITGQNIRVDGRLTP